LLSKTSLEVRTKREEGKKEEESCTPSRLPLS